MIYYDILTKHDKELWQIVELAVADKSIGTTENLAYRLDLTTFIVEKRLKTLDKMWRELFSVPSPIHEEESISISNQEVAQFQRQLLEESVSNVMLMELFLDRLDMQSFPKAHRVSQATTYRIRKELGLVLAEYGLSLNGSKLKGDELLIRSLFLSVLLFRQLDQKALMDDYSFQVTMEMLKGLRTRIEGTLRPSEQRLLENFAFVAVSRILAHREIGGAFRSMGGQPDMRLVRELQSFIRMEEKAAKGEVAYFDGFLYAYGFTSSAPRAEDGVAKRVAALEDLFLPTMEMILDLSNLASEERRLLPLRLSQLHWRHALFPYSQSRFSFDRTPEWSEYFSDFFEIVKDLLASSDFLVTTPHITEAEKNHMAYDYLYLLMDYASDKRDYPKVYVCVDFSESPALTEIITRVLSLVWFSTIILQETIDAQTDLYLTDAFDQVVPIQQVIWRKPPDYSEQFEFWSLVGAISARKAIVGDREGLGKLVPMEHGMRRGSA